MCEYNYSLVGENIYEELCSVGDNRNQQVITGFKYFSLQNISNIYFLLQAPYPPQQLPVDQREYCIRELVESEKRYVEALGMIKTNFIRPLSTVLNQDEKK